MKRKKTIHNIRKDVENLSRSSKCEFIAVLESRIVFMEYSRVLFNCLRTFSPIGSIAHAFLQQKLDLVLITGFAAYISFAFLEKRVEISIQRVRDRIDSLRDDDL